MPTKSSVALVVAEINKAVDLVLLGPNPWNGKGYREIKCKLDCDSREGAISRPCRNRDRCVTSNK